MHRDYWHEKDNDKEEDDVREPDIYIYIANLWLAELKEEPLSLPTISMKLYH